jgi:hypothetical protein
MYTAMEFSKCQAYLPSGHLLLDFGFYEFQVVASTDRLNSSASPLSVE